MIKTSVHTVDNFLQKLEEQNVYRLAKNSSASKILFSSLTSICPDTPPLLCLCHVRISRQNFDKSPLSASVRTSRGIDYGTKGPFPVSDFPSDLRRSTRSTSRSHPRFYKLFLSRARKSHPLALLSMLKEAKRNFCHGESTTCKLFSK